jgi:hypothetical protein
MKAMMSLKSLKEQYLASTPFGDPAWRENLPLDELMAAWAFLGNPSDENYVKVVIEKLKAERKRLTESTVPKAEWPKELTPDDWEARVWEGFGIKRESKETL